MAIQKCEKKEPPPSFMTSIVSQYCITTPLQKSQCLKITHKVSLGKITIVERTDYFCEFKNETILWDFQTLLEFPKLLIIINYTCWTVFQVWKEVFGIERETKEQIKGDFMPIQYIVLRVITRSYMWPRFIMPFWHKSAFDGKVPVFLVLVLPLSFAFAESSHHRHFVSRFH